MPHNPKEPVSGIINSAFVESKVDLNQLNEFECKCSDDLRSTTAVAAAQQSPESQPNGHTVVTVPSTVCVYDMNRNHLDNSCPVKPDLDPVKNGTNFVSSNGTGGANDKSFDPSKPDSLVVYEVQTSWSVFRQMLIPFTIAGFGSVFAGIVLNTVSRWVVFQDIPQLQIMVSAFLGLIGNIETTLASRLSTHANLGRMDHWDGLREILSGNFLVVQCQASTVGLFAALTSLTVSTIKEKTRSKINLERTLLLCSSSVITSIIANTLLATVISLVIVVSRKLRINPDNISTPVAASMGDVCTITILAYVSQWLYDMETQHLLHLGLLCALLVMAPVFGYFARHNRWTHSVIYTGWSAILGAVIIEQPGGIVMESAFEQYKVMSTFQPLVNGIGSNLVGIQTSRMSTFLHASAPKGQLPASNPTPYVSPIWTFFSKDTHARMARLLLIVLVPAHLFYMAVIYLLQSQFSFSIVFTFPFVLTYVTAVVIQLVILLYLAYVSVFWAWRKRINPDNSAIPFTSALADVLGNCLMAAAFTLLKAINDANANILETEDDLIGPWIHNGTTTIGQLFANSTTTMATILGE